MQRCCGFAPRLSSGLAGHQLFQVVLAQASKTYDAPERMISFAPAPDGPQEATLARLRRELPCRMRSACQKDRGSVLRRPARRDGAQARRVGAAGRSYAAFAILFAVLLPFALHPAQPTNALAQLQKIHRIVFIGDSITYSGQYVESVEAYFVTRFPEQRIEFLNLGLPSETVSGLAEEGHAGGKFPRPDLRERLARVLEKTKPDLVIACYGMNDGIYLPFSDERFQKFKDGLLWLREQVKAAGAEIIHITPPTFDEVKGGHAGYSNTLDRYSDWLLDQRATGWDVVDLHGPMNRYLAERRQRDLNFFLASDGVHCNETGHWIIAKQILLHLGAKDMVSLNDPEAMLALHPRGKEILKLVQAKQRMLKDAWLTDTGHKRPGMKQGLPLAEAKAKAAELDKHIHDLAAAGSSH